MKYFYTGQDDNKIMLTHGKFTNDKCYIITEEVTDTKHIIYTYDDNNSYVLLYDYLLKHYFEAVQKRRKRIINEI